MSDETMQAPPCADHGYNRLDCPECGDARRIHYEKLAASLDLPEVPVTYFGGESTSARLRRVEQERDEAVRRAADLEQVREELKQVRLLADGYAEDIQHLQSGQDEVIDSLRTARDSARAELDSARTELGHLRRERDQLRADLTEALDELQQLRYSGWIVARDGGRTCTSCDQEIRRGEAYSVDATGDQLTHVHCPEATP